jgi:hypothetical protein
MCIDWGVCRVRWKFYEEFSEDKRFLSLWGAKIEVVFLENNDPMSEFVVDLAMTQEVVHGVGILN